MLEVLHNPSQPLLFAKLAEGRWLDPVAFAAWYGNRRWLATSKDQPDAAPLCKRIATPVELALEHGVPDATVALLRAAQVEALTVKTLAGDALAINGWEDAWTHPGANLAHALVAENHAILRGVYGDELESVNLPFVLTSAISFVCSRYDGGAEACVLYRRTCTPTSTPVSVAASLHQFANIHLPFSLLPTHLTSQADRVEPRDDGAVACCGVSTVDCSGCGGGRGGWGNILQYARAACIARGYGRVCAAQDRGACRSGSQRATRPPSNQHALGKIVVGSPGQCRW
jgi:hypothetical protein